MQILGFIGAMVAAFLMVVIYFGVEAYDKIKGVR